MTMLYKPTYKTMIVGFFSRLSRLVLFLQLDEPTSFFHSKPLVQEGIDEQINVLLLLLHMQSPPYTLSRVASTQANAVSFHNKHTLHFVSFVLAFRYKHREGPDRACPYRKFPDFLALT